MSFLKTCLFAVIFPGWFRLQNQNKEFGKISPNVRLMEILRNFLPVARNALNRKKPISKYLKYYTAKNMLQFGKMQVRETDIVGDFTQC